MKTFEAKKAAIEIKAITLEGQEVFLKNKETLSGGFAKKIMKHWQTIEANFAVDDSNIEGKIDIVVKQLSFVLGKEPDWYLDNFDMATLNDMLMYVVQVIGGAEKKDESSS